MYRTAQTPAIQDIVRELGFLTLGTRFKRVGERLQAHAQEILDAHDLSVPAGQFPFLAALDRLGPLTIGELAESTGVTQPAATRAVGQLVEAGLVSITPSRDDQRCKSVALAAEGKRLVAAGKRTAWRVIERSVRELCGDLRGPLLDQLTSLEQGLAERSRRR